ncbi:sigma factor for T4 late transcription [Aeromonas phage phiAS5]|uniref:RNA polymerase sigma-like factor n=1 Tax=Aeromonas phage phiAS5 TaxID=879630 RepID=E1A2Q6_9CAUD|nr:late sigma transcription factor [Aeromonas phage phiAS5]ADM80002.1 sigma factor for T4 late transcription [Aeromonas phage phiAS5]
MANYVDNEWLYQEFKSWKDHLKENPNHPMPNSIGSAIMKIANGFTNYWRFSRYTDTWKELMVGDAVETCLKYCKNFDTDRYTNPHAYITMICARAFIARIRHSKKEEAAKYKYFLEHVHDAEDEDMAKLVDLAFYNDMMTKANDFEANLKKTKAKKPKQPVGLSFLEDDEDDTE